MLCVQTGGEIVLAPSLSCHRNVEFRHLTAWQRISHACAQLVVISFLELLSKIHLQYNFCCFFILKLQLLGCSVNKM